MSTKAISRRYAAALHQEAAAAGSISRVDEDVDLVAQTVDGSRELRLLFQSPVVGSDKKEVIVRRLFGSEVSDLVLSFLLLTVRKRREGLIPEMLAAYESLRLEEQGIVEATARVAVPVGEAEVDDLQSSLSKMVGSDIRLEIVDDPTLIGGIVVKVGDRVYDGSLRSRLATLRRQMETGTFQTN